MLPDEDELDCRGEIGAERVRESNIESELKYCRNVEDGVDGE